MLIDKYFRVTKHGFVALKNFMGDDHAIERAARVSCGKGTRQISDTRALIRHLLSSSPPHMAPTEAGYAEFHIRSPLYIQTQLLRYRWGSPNVYSGRYSEMLELFYTPEEFMFQSSDNKQGASQPIDPKDSAEMTAAWDAVIEQILNIYHKGLDMGIAREQMRGIIPYNVYSDMYYRVHLRNLFHIIEERVHPGAQPEVQEFGEIFGGIANELFPITFSMWQEYQFESIKLTKKEAKALRAYNNFPHSSYATTKAFEQEFLPDYGKRQINEFWHKFAKIDSADHEFKIPWDKLIEVKDTDKGVCIV